MSPLFMCLALAVGGTADAAAQTTQLPPSEKLAQQCRSLGDATRDMADAAVMYHGEELTGFMGVVDRTLEARKDCWAVWELLSVYEMLSPGSDRNGVSGFVRARMDKYATELDPSITFLNQWAVASPKQARTAENMRDKIRALAELIRQLGAEVK